MLYNAFIQEVWCTYNRHCLGFGTINGLFVISLQSLQLSLSVILEPLHCASGCQDMCVSGKCWIFGHLCQSERRLPLQMYA